MNIIDSLLYVINAPYFWHTMGWTTASAMFIGSTLYNGDLKLFTKGVITIVPYTTFIVFVNALRIANRGIENHILAYAGNITIGIITAFYLLGLFIGVLVTRFAHRKSKDDFRTVH